MAMAPEAVQLIRKSQQQAKKKNSNKLLKKIIKASTKTV